MLINFPSTINSRCSIEILLAFCSLINYPLSAVDAIVINYLLLAVNAVLTSNLLSAVDKVLINHLLSAVDKVLITTCNQQ